MVSWLSSLAGPVRNRPVDDSLAGPAPTPLLAAAVAAASGLHVHRAVGLDSSSDPPCDPAAATMAAVGGRGVRRQVVLLDGIPFGADLDDHTGAAMRTMVSGVGAAEAIVGLDFVVDRGTWWFVGMTPLPELPASAEFVDTLVRVLDATPAVATQGGPR
jgi:hypothetical protein